VVIAIAILSVGLIGSIRVFPVGLRASSRAEWMSLATLAAERTMESLKLAPWDDLAEGESTEEDGDFNVTVKIDQAAVQGLVDSTGLKRIAVTVEWQQEGRARGVTLATYVHRPRT